MWKRRFRKGMKANQKKHQNRSYWIGFVANFHRACRSRISPQTGTMVSLSEPWLVALSFPDIFVMTRAPECSWKCTAVCFGIRFSRDFQGQCACPGSSYGLGGMDSRKCARKYREGYENCPGKTWCGTCKFFRMIFLYSLILSISRNLCSVFSWKITLICRFLRIQSISRRGL